MLLKLVRDADVLVHNFRPSVPKRLGIDHERLNLINPRLIYCAVTGYGETGPMKDKAGYDQVLQTMTGMCALQGKRGGAPEIIYGSVVDYYAAALLAAGVSSALYERERSGLGQFVGVSLLRSALTMQSARMIWAEGEALDIGRDMRSGGVTGIHPTRDGYIYISANTAHFWKALCEKTGLHAAGRGCALRQRPQARAARRGDRAEAACGADARTMRSSGKRCSATRCLARRRAHRGHVRPSAGAGRRHGGHARAPGGGPLPRRHASDQVRPHARPRAVRGAGARPAFRGGDRGDRRAAAESRGDSRKFQTPATLSTARCGILVAGLRRNP